MKLKEKLKKKQPEKKNKGISEKKSFKKKIKSSFNGKYIKNGSYSMLISVIFIVIFIVINMIVNVLPTKYSEIDVSDQKLFSIGKQTEGLSGCRLQKSCCSPHKQLQEQPLRSGRSLQKSGSF